MTNTPIQSDDSRPRAVQNGMSQAEYDTWIFLADKQPLDEPYTYAIKQSDLTKFIKAYSEQIALEAMDTMIDLVKAHIDLNPTETTVSLMEAQRDIQVQLTTQKPSVCDCIYGDGACEEHEDKEKL